MDELEEQLKDSKKVIEKAESVAVNATACSCLTSARKASNTLRKHFVLETENKNKTKRHKVIT
jgi:hypothetical protein